MTLADDEALWGRALGSDGRAFAELFDRHHHRVFRHAMKLLLSAHDADDVMAAAFFELWRRRVSVPLVDRSVLPWLLATATNICRNRTRGLLRYQTLLARLPRGEEEDPADIASERVEDQRRRTLIVHALRQISATDAALLTLTVFEGLTPTEAAETVGISSGAARTRLHRARHKLRGLLADLDAGAGPELLPEGLI